MCKTIESRSPSVLSEKARRLLDDHDKTVQANADKAEDNARTFSTDVTRS
jgi:hypothetical protein